MRILIVGLALVLPSVGSAQEQQWGELQGSVTLKGKTPPVVDLTPRLEAAMERLNPDASRNAIEIAIQEVAKDRSAMSAARANQAARASAARLVQEAGGVHDPSAAERA